MTKKGYYMMRGMKEEILAKDDELEKNSNVVGISVMIHTAYDNETNILIRKREEPGGPLHEPTPMHSLTSMINVFFPRRHNTSPHDLPQSQIISTNCLFPKRTLGASPSKK